MLTLSMRSSLTHSGILCWISVVKGTADIGGIYSSISSSMEELLSAIWSLRVVFSDCQSSTTTFPSNSPSLLSSFLSAIVSSDHYHVITPFHTTTNHRLALTHSLSLDVAHSSSSLSAKLSDKIKSEISTTPSPLRSNLISISYYSIDSIIKQDFEREKPLQGVYIYLLNFGSQPKPYAYKYTDTSDSSLGVTKCSGSIWTGKGRYLWMDLSAGPVDYGPTLSGDWSFTTAPTTHR